LIAAHRDANASCNAFVVISLAINSTNRSQGIRTKAIILATWALLFTRNLFSRALGNTSISIGLLVKSTDWIVEQCADTVWDDVVIVVDSLVVVIGISSPVVIVIVAGTRSITILGDSFAAGEAFASVGDSVCSTNRRTSRWARARDVVAGTFLAARNFYAGAAGAIAVIVGLSVSPANGLQCRRASTRAALTALAAVVVTVVAVVKVVVVLCDDIGNSNKEKERTQEAVHCSRRFTCF